MRNYRKWTRIATVLLWAFGAAAAWSQAADAPSQDSPARSEEAAIRALGQQLLQAFNQGKADAVADLFLPEGEIKDDAGRVHQGRPQIAALLGRFFERFPGVKIETQIESIRTITATLAILDGTQTIVTKDGQTKSVHEFTAVLAKTAGAWRFASFQESAEEAEATPHERLQPLAWLVGDWVNEAADAVINLKCRWSDEQNFLLVRYESKVEGKPAIKSTQWIGWDPLHERITSWVFDSDGGHGQAQWTKADTSWIVKSTAVMPDGQTGSATLVFEPQGADKFSLRGLDRVLGDGTQPDFQMTIVRQPPQPSK